MKPYIVLTALAALAPHAAAQQQTARPYPADPAAVVPAARYESTLTGYRGYRDGPLAPWRGVNDEVARAGGHVGILRGTGGSASGTAAGAAETSIPPGAGAK